MAFDIVGFSEAAPGANGTLAAGGSDSLYKTSGDDIYVRPGLNYLLGVLYAAESTGQQVAISQPDLPVDYQFFRVMDTADVDPSGGYTHMFARPLPLVPNQKVNATVVNATDEDQLVGLILGSGKIPHSSLDAVNPTHRLRGYSDTTVTANTWSACSITWDQTLPEGRYAVVGMEVGVWLTANPWAAIARLTGLKVAGQPQYRPGVPCAIMEADHEMYSAITQLPFAHWPVMPGVSFTHDDPPNIEVLGPAAHTDENVELLLQKIG